MGQPLAIEVLRQAVSDMGGAYRAGQEDLVRAAVRAVETGEPLLAQAGTGTGKSLAYLAVVLTEASVNNLTAVITTATLALQKQILDKDGPRVAAAVKELCGTAPSIAVLKGWQNYLCLHKVAGGYPPEEELDLFGTAGSCTPRSLGSEVLALRAWGSETATGDRDDIPGISERAWRQVSVSKLQCLGAKCPFRDDCFAEIAKATAFAADVVVTNHAMVGVAVSGSPGALPDSDILVVDEAHELTSRVTGAATMELSGAVISRLAKAAGRLTAEAAGELEQVATLVAFELDELGVGRLRSLPESLLGAVVLLGEAARNTLRAVRRSSAEEGARAVVSAALVELEEVTVRLLSDSVVAHRDVAWVSRGLDGAGATRLLVAPLDVASLIRPLAQERKLIATSATMQLGGGFEQTSRALGLGGEGAQKWWGEDFGSPFDYSAQAIIYVASHLPRPSRQGVAEEALEELVELMGASGGGVLGLFSSRRGAERAAVFARERVATPVLCQGEAQLSELVRQFADDPDASLFGTLSLWQGIDVPGETCRLVVIDRIPFPRPDDPISSARAEHIEARGGSGFYEVSVSHAALLLAQGVGRLIRGAEDRGVVAILDPRLALAPYGRFLMRSLPPMWPTRDLAVVLQSLGSLRPAG